MFFMFDELFSNVDDGKLLKKKKNLNTAMFPFCCVLYFWPNMFKLSHGNMESVFKSVKGSFAFRFTTLGE